MSDLNKRLQLGPQAPKKEEPVAEEGEEEKEKAPLSDARKGRARGPVRRAPAKSPAPATELATVIAATATLGFSKPTTLWHLDPDDGMLSMTFSGNKASVIPESKDTVVPESKAPESSAPTSATNTAGENLHDAADGPSWKNVSLKPVAGKPIFRMTPPQYVTPELVEFVRGKLEKTAFGS